MSREDDVPGVDVVVVFVGEADISALAAASITDFDGGERGGDDDGGGDLRRTIFSLPRVSVWGMGGVGVMLSYHWTAWLTLEKKDAKIDFHTHSLNMLQVKVCSYSCTRGTVLCSL